MRINGVNFNRLKKLSIFHWIIVSSLIIGSAAAIIADALGIIDIDFPLGEKKINVERHYNTRDKYSNINREDKYVYDIIGNLFEGRENMEYLMSKMLSNKPYLEFYYVNPIGSKVTSGWTTDVTNPNVTGLIRLAEPKYFGYRIVYKDDKFVKEKSPLVDDFREIMGDYPLFSDDFYTYVYSEYRYPKEALASLTVDDVKNPNKTTEINIDEEDIRQL